MNQFVAGFIGSPAMNLLTAPLTDGGVRLAGTVIPLPAGARAAAARDKLSELVIGIRPEHLHLSGTGAGAADAGAAGAGAASAAPAGRGELAGEVLLVEELGADALLHVRLAGDAAVPGDAPAAGEAAVVGGTPVVARTQGRRYPAPGQRVAFGVQPDDIFAFHPVTGARLAG